MNPPFLHPASALALALFLFGPAVAEAASVTRTYSYFTIGGASLEDLQEQLNTRGPVVKSTGQRHPGATVMEFTKRLQYRGRKGACRIGKADVSVKASITLPRWTAPKNASAEARLVWDTLSSDIKRHEEAHVNIAKKYANEIERELLAVPPQKTCEIAAEKGREVFRRGLARHHAAHVRFDQSESRTFSGRMDRLLRARMKRIDAGRIPG